MIGCSGEPGGDELTPEPISVQRLIEIGCDLIYMSVYN
jgi:hypothetical protein